jgi:hypothetical protein
MKRKAPEKASQCWTYLRGVLADNYPRIVEGFVAKAFEGGPNELRLVTEIVRAPWRRRARVANSPAAKWLAELEREIAGME